MASILAQLWSISRTPTVCSIYQFLAVFHAPAEGVSPSRLPLRWQAHSITSCVLEGVLPVLTIATSLNKGYVRQHAFFPVPLAPTLRFLLHYGLECHPEVQVPNSPPSCAHSAGL